MAALYATPALLAAGPSNTFYLAAVQDANAHLAVAQTPFYQTPSGLLMPALADENGYPYTKTIGRNHGLGTYSVSFAASAAAGTTETVAVPLPTPPQAAALYLVALNNPSSLDTAVTVTFQNGMLFGGTTPIYATVTSVTVASGAVTAYLIQGWLLGDAAAQISVVTSSAASSSGGTVQIEVVLV